MWFNKKNEDKFKLISINTYAWDRTINNTRRYRKVFDKSELNYLSVAFEFYNKFFDEKDWKMTVNFKAFRLKNGEKEEELCSHTDEFTITKDLNIAVCDYGWGNEEHGSYWNEGDYLWEIYANDEFIDSTKFHVYDIGKVTNEYNPYFEVESIKTFDYIKINGEQTEEKLYIMQFVHNEVTYIMTEFVIVNRVAYKWLCELTYNYYDDSGLLIGSSHDIGYINSGNNNAGGTYTMTNGWGSKDASVWLKDDYRVEVVFMDNVVAKFHFSVGDGVIYYDQIYEELMEEAEIVGSDSAKEEHLIDDYVDETESKEEQIIENDTLDTNEETVEGLDYSYLNEKKPLEQLLKELDELIGLDEIKQKIRDFIDYTVYLQLRKEKGVEENDEIKLHSVFTGNPGTGKTTVVKLLGQVFHSMGLLSKGHVHTVESSDLVAGFVRQTGKNTKEAIEKAKGGILFVDEAYMLYKKGSSGDFGDEAIAALITEMSDGTGDIAIMIAGYPAPMKEMINSNPGLKSRFKYHYHFKDYTPDELIAIGNYYSNKKGVSLSENASEKLRKIVTEAYRNRNETFGNARFVNSIIDEAKMNLGIRLIRDNQDKEVDFTLNILSTIKAEDIEDVSQIEAFKSFNLGIDNELLQESLLELNKLTGLDSVKKEVYELVKLVKYYKEIDRDILKAFSMHSVFIGNPGTGKTTIARILSKIYKALGLLERGHLVETDASGLIAGFVGQTALKTKELIKQAKDGILFIDEAYSITSGRGTGTDFGKKAISALLKEMEDHRGEFGVVVAGYTDNMKTFLKSNPGLNSRFDTTFIFEDFNETQLWEICLNMYKQKNVQPNIKAEAHLKKYISHLVKNKNKFFGNARTIRKVVEKTFRNQQLRIADTTSEKRTNQLKKTVILNDVIDFNTTKESLVKSASIGYKR